MILGTPRGWWIAAGLLFLVGLALLATGSGGTLGSVGGGLMIIVAMLVFAGAPMRYGRDRPNAAAKSAAPPPAAAPRPPAAPRGPRPEIEGRDASEV